jgi:L-threonylcarbamoyladenylate synthase
MPASTRRVEAARTVRAHHSPARPIVNHSRHPLMTHPPPRVLKPTPDAIAEAISALAQGALVGLPTETVYGLAADATNPAAVARIYSVKGRPSFNPLIAHVADLSAAEDIGILTDDAVRLAARFWPGPLTLVVTARPEGAVCDLARAGLETVALRVPDHEVAQAVLRGFGKPIAAPSANRSGHVSATTAEHVQNDVGSGLALILDAGPAPKGLESTIVSVVGSVPTLLRAGMISREAIEAALGRKLGVPGPGIAAPGMLERHYAPRSRLRLDATTLRMGEVGLAFAGVPAGARLDLSPSGNPTEASANLYAHLRALDALGADAIAVGPIPLSGLGEAIRDRLARAALGR